ncbi:MAG: prepilin-type N-terminal cleavage/methylation domain-containing protein [Candidatus Omnitrophota bacterium]
MISRKTKNIHLDIRPGPRSTGKPVNRLTGNGFSLVEIMITVVIIGVCMVMTLRVFSFCAKAVSEAYNSTYAVDILQDKINDLREKAIMEAGITVSSSMESLEKGGRNFEFTQESIIWENPMIDLEEIEGIEEFEETVESSTLSLCEVTLEVSWRSGVQKRNLIIKTLLPAKESEVIL